MNRRSRFFAALVALAALAFVQLALPAQGCPRLAGVDAMIHAASADEAAAMEGMPCKGHCAESAKSFDAVKPVAATPVAAIAAPLRVALPVTLSRRAAPIAAPAAPGPAPPLPRSTVLRI